MQSLRDVKQAKVTMATQQHPLAQKLRMEPRDTVFWTLHVTPEGNTDVIIDAVKQGLREQSKGKLEAFERAIYLKSIAGTWDEIVNFSADDQHVLQTIK